MVSASCAKNSFLKEHCWDKETGCTSEWWTLTAQVTWPGKYSIVFRNHIRTHQEHSRLYLSLFSARKCIWDAFCTPVCTLWCQCCKKQCQLVVGHTLRYTVSKFGGNWTNGSQDTAIFVPPPSVAIQTHCQNVNLSHSIYFWYTTHGLPGASSCTTPYIQLSCQWPDARVLPIQVPAWDLDQNLQDQGWGKTWLPALHPGQRGLCCHGQMGTSRWSAQEWPC